MPSFKFKPRATEVEPKFSEEHKARIQRTMGIPAYDYQKMAKLRGAPRDFTGSYSNVGEDALSDLYLMGRLFPPAVPEAGGVTVGQSKVIPTAASSVAPNTTAPTAMAMAPAPRAVNRSATKSVNSKSPVAPVANVPPAGILKSVTNSDSEFLQGMDNSPAPIASSPAPDKAMLDYKPPPINYQLGSPTTNTQGTKSVATPDMAKAAGELPKTKSGMKKFMDEYGKFIALGALAGTGGKGGAIAAPIMAALPGILKMLQNRGKKNTGAPAGASSFPALPTSGGDNPPAASSFPDLPTSGGDYAHGGLLGNKSAAHPKKKMAGGSIRKFSGGVMKKVTKKFAEGGEGKSDKRESAFNRLTPRFEGGLSLLGTGTPLRKDSISKKLLKEEDTRYRPFADSKEETNDKDMKMALASIIDEMFNAKNRMPAKGGLLDEYKMFDSKEYESPIVSEMYDKKYSGTAGVPYDSPSFKARQARQISPSVKVSGDKTPKKMVGGTIRKFSGGKLISKLIEKMESAGDGERAGMLRQNIPNKYMKYMSKPTQEKSSLNSASPSITIIGEESDDYKYSKGGAVRKFKGGAMNTMKDNLMPKYKKGGDMPKGMPKEMMAMMGKKGKATGDMPERKKMDMGMPIGEMPNPKKMGMAKPKPSSMDQKFAKGGTARYASGGMCKGYGMAKKIRPTGSMN